MAKNDQIVCICEVLEAGQVSVRGVTPLCPVHGDPRDTSVGAKVPVDQEAMRLYHYLFRRIRQDLDAIRDMIEDRG